MRNPRPEPGARDSSDTGKSLPGDALVSSKSRASIQARRNGKAASGRRNHFARQATIAAFGWRYAKALDQAGFVDRRPWDRPTRAPATNGWRHDG